MLKSRLVYILLANIAVLSANVWFHYKNEPKPLTQFTAQAQEPLHESPDRVEKESTKQIVLATASAIDSQTQDTSVGESKQMDSFAEVSSTQASVALATSGGKKTQQALFLNKQNEKIRQQQLALQSLYQKQQQELARLRAENRRLADQVSSLENQVNIRNEYIAESKEREQELKQVLQEQEKSTVKLSNSSIENIKTSIDQQPDLLKSQTESTVTPVQNNPNTENVVVNSQLDNEEVGNDVVLFNEQEGEEAKHFTGGVEFGFTYERDNQRTQGVKGRLILDYDQVDQYNINSDLEFEFESEDRVSTTEKYRWQLQGDYHLDPKNILFARSDIQRSKFASYEREDTFTTGYGRIFFNENNHKLNTEIGPGYKFAVPNVGEEAVSVNEFILRTRLNYEKILSDTLQVTMEGVAELGKENSVFSTQFRGQKRVYQELYLIFEFNYKYYQNVPVDTEHDEVSSGLSILYAF